tara:strand:+ start:1499 stop:2929 length:1431 start_codon:yes stop_codon:yes gene_type:complete
LGIADPTCQIETTEDGMLIMSHTNHDDVLVKYTVGSGGAMSSILVDDREMLSGPNTIEDTDRVGQTVLWGNGNRFTIANTPVDGGYDYTWRDSGLRRFNQNQAGGAVDKGYPGWEERPYFRRSPIVAVVVDSDECQVEVFSFMPHQFDAGLDLDVFSADNFTHWVRYAITADKRLRVEKALRFASFKWTDDVHPGNTEEVIVKPYVEDWWCYDIDRDNPNPEYYTNMEFVVSRPGDLDDDTYPFESCTADNTPQCIPRYPRFPIPEAEATCIPSGDEPDRGCPPHNGYAYVQNDGYGVAMIFTTKPGKLLIADGTVEIDATIPRLNSMPFGPSAPRTPDGDGNGRSFPRPPQIKEDSWGDNVERWPRSKGICLLSAADDGNSRNMTDGTVLSWSFDIYATANTAAQHFQDALQSGRSGEMEYVYDFSPSPDDPVATCLSAISRGALGIGNETNQLTQSGLVKDRDEFYQQCRDATT